MLTTIKQYISNLDDTDFDTFYQDYVVSVQDSIVNHQMTVDSKKFTNIESITSLFKSINTLVEDLKKNDIISRF